MANLLIILGIILLLAGFGIPKKDKTTDVDLESIKWLLKIGAVGLFIISFLLASITLIPAGNRGVVLEFGKVKRELNEGLNFVTPYIDGVEVVEVQTQKEQATATAASKDLQTVTTQVAINYHIDPAQVGKLYTTVGMSYGTKIIDPALQEVVKAVVAGYTAEELIKDRIQVKAALDEKLTTRLAQYDLIIEPNGVSLKDFDFSKTFKDSIEAKQVAGQRAEQANFHLQQAKIDAQTAIVKAQGEAESAKIRATALNVQGGDKVIAQAWIEAWKEGGSKVPQVITGGAGSNFMLNLGDLSTAKK